MNWTPSFRRKVLYVVGMAALLYPLFALGMPATVEKDSGGVLARTRDRYGLAQASLGEVDPVSEAMKLSTLGLRGIASTVLSIRGDEYKDKKDWTKLRATLEQIAR